jgi:hypothetical protein
MERGVDARTRGAGASFQGHRFGRRRHAEDGTGTEMLDCLPVKLQLKLVGPHGLPLESVASVA